jgi:hypothetical protein
MKEMKQHVMIVKKGIDISMIMIALMIAQKCLGSLMRIRPHVLHVKKNIKIKNILA